MIVPPLSFRFLGSILSVVLASSIVFDMILNFFFHLLQGNILEKHHKNQSIHQGLDVDPEPADLRVPFKDSRLCVTINVNF